MSETTESTEMIDVAGDRYPVRPLLGEDFQDLSRWHRPEDHGRWLVRDGALVGEWLSASPSIFLTDKIAGDYLWQVRVTRVRPDAEFTRRFAAHPQANGCDPRDKYNFNFWLRADAPDGTDFFQQYPRYLGTGWNGMGDDHWRSRFATVVWNADGTNWTRLRKSPGYELACDVQNVLPFLPYDEPHDVTFALGRGRVRMYVDDRRVYDHADATLPPAGYIGLCVWLCVVRFEQMRLYRMV